MLSPSSELLRTGLSRSASMVALAMNERKVSLVPARS
jgi:hypothetical protein